MTPEQKYMRQALDLAHKGEGRTAPNPPVGAVVVRENIIVGRGFHPCAGQPHAEIFALQEAGALTVGADLYVTLEPCSHQGRTGPCTEAIKKAGIARVFAGTRDPNPRVDGKGLAQLEASGIQTACGILEDECKRLIAPFAKVVRTGLPYVILKAAMTLDGQIATSSGDSRWISSDPSREKVHRLRDRMDAVMVGAGTVIKDDPRLTTRLQDGGRDAIRVVVDSALRVPEHAQVFHLESSAPTLLAVSSDIPSDRIRPYEKPGVQVMQVSGRNGRIDLAVLLRELGKMDIHSILLEGGSRLNAEMWHRQLIDRLMLFIAPRILGGGDGLTLFSGEGVRFMKEALQLEDVRYSYWGPDILIEGEVPNVHRAD
ncbi:MAG: bifunctional diaminohydroxyphosphoribosylaminopyrimidine deaminase/5-amino-6-(5-phosphoribosylamino)uracil reductase RibD [Deltaproteobacteria bacterium]|nr:bifunctional diaminohydroxyphosphoribosylaminopyrimidine deaminase/5-amino-6-(5-phosphoribosylamino)uracil reductase RibD [Deltaproteobacteria bacterium]